MIQGQKRDKVFREMILIDELSKKGGWTFAGLLQVLRSSCLLEGKVVLLPVLSATVSAGQ